MAQEARRTDILPAPVSQDAPGRLPDPRPAGGAPSMQDMDPAEIGQAIQNGRPLAPYETPPSTTPAPSPAPQSGQGQAASQPFSPTIPETFPGRTGMRFPVERPGNPTPQQPATPQSAPTAPDSGNSLDREQRTWLARDSRQRNVTIPVTGGIAVNGQFRTDEELYKMPPEFQGRKVFTYVQSTGELRDPDGNRLEIGYSGQGAGKNNPELQHVPNIGPLPAGLWEVGEAYYRNTTGPVSRPLTPLPGNLISDTERGKRDFFMHGESTRRSPGTASKGCPVISPKHRNPDFLPTGSIIHSKPK